MDLSIAAMVHHSELLLRAIPKFKSESITTSDYNIIINTWVFSHYPTNNNDLIFIIFLQYLLSTLKRKTKRLLNVGESRNAYCYIFVYRNAT